MQTWNEKIYSKWTCQNYLESSESSVEIREFGRKKVCYVSRLKPSIFSISNLMQSRKKSWSERDWITDIEKQLSSRFGPVHKWCFLLSSFSPSFNTIKSSQKQERKLMQTSLMSPDMIRDILQTKAFDNTISFYWIWIWMNSTNVFLWMWFNLSETFDLKALSDSKALDSDLSFPSLLWV